jgi:hypothetical protein
MTTGGLTDAEVAQQIAEGTTNADARRAAMIVALA